MRQSKPDYVFMAMLAAILAVGFVVLTSASGPLGSQQFHDGFHFIKRQFYYGLLPGVVFFLVFAKIDYRFWRRWWPHLYVLSLAMLILVFVPGLAAPWGTSRSWIGIGGFSFQPIEFVKLTFLLALAGWLQAVGERQLADWRQGPWPFLIGLGLVAALVMAQPDTGGLLVIAGIAMAEYFVAGAPWSHLAGFAAMAAVGVAAIVVTAPYRLARLTTFLHPAADPLGRGYHINQAFLAIGSGGLIGLGLGHSRQKFLYLPEVAGDSIMAVMAEELGFVVMLLFLIFFLAFLMRGLSIAKRAHDDFGRFIVTGIMAWVAVQAALNIGSMVGLMPITGLPFPFVSSGGTALTAMLAAMGVVVNVSRYGTPAR